MNCRTDFRQNLAVVATLLVACLAASGNCLAEDLMHLQLTSQRETAPGSGRFHFVEQTEDWNASETAVIVCDVWDYHHCLNAVRRLEEFAPQLDAVLKRAREQGATIIHSPSDCMPAYADHPARLRAVAVPAAANAPYAVESWCSMIPAEERAVYPIDQSDGGEDDDSAEHAVWRQKLIDLGRNPGMPWKRQSDLITIDPERDFISDKGDEVWNVLESRGIKNVILTGVHVNMCVLGRPFGLRQMARNGKRVVLMRDMTDAMYNPQQWPYVSHFTGNDLVISHIERFVCPTVTSDQILGGQAFRFSGDKRPHVVMVIAEDPYDTKTTLPAFAAAQLGKDFRVTVLHASEQEPNTIPGLKAVQSADVLLLSARRRTLPAADLELLRSYVASGKPVIALRTSSHAFALREGAPPEGYADWPQFDAEVLGGNYHGSYPDELRSTIRIPQLDEAPAILNGVGGIPFEQGGHMYKTGPLAVGARIVLEGHVDGHDPEPVAWTYTRKEGGESTYIALGHPADFQQPGFTQLLKNAIYLAGGLQLPTASKSTSVVEELHRRWNHVTLPSAEPEIASAALGCDCGWYRCVVYIPATWKAASELRLDLPKQNLQGWFNGESLAENGSLPSTAINFGDYNLLVMRTKMGEFSINEAPVLQGADRPLTLAGTWQLRLGPAAADLENMPLPAKFGGGADIVFTPEEPLWTACPLTQPGEFTPGIEGPACDRHGNLFAVNFGSQGTIGRITPGGSGEVFLKLPGDSVGNGIRFDQQGHFYIADYVNHNIWRVNESSRELSLLAHQPAMSQPNDVAIADDGTLYASDPNWAASTGQLWRIDQDGTTTLLARDLGTTNGIDISPDGKTLYVNESVQRNVWAFTITPEKNLSDKRLIKKFDDHGFDGMRVDVDGNLYISRYGKGTVLKMTPQGEILQEVNVLGAQPSNVCFGGPDGRTVYVTEVEYARIVAFRVDRPGRSWKLWHKEN